MPPRTVGNKGSKGAKLSVGTKVGKSKGAKPVRPKKKTRAVILRDTPERRMRAAAEEAIRNVTLSSCKAARRKYAKRPDRDELIDHLSAAAAHGEHYQQRYDNEGVSAHLAKVTEAVGETQACHYVAQTYPGYQLLRGFSAGTGIDQIWGSQLGTANAAYLVVEAKGPGAKRSEGADKGDQMELRWVCLSVIEELKSAEAKDDRLAGRVLTDMAKGLSKGPPPEVHGIVVGVSKDGTTVGEQPLPIDAKFCGGNYTGKGGSFFT